MTGAPREPDTRIFVQIPAYRDSELAPTLLSLYRRARHPERLRTVVLWQKDPEDSLPDSVYKLPDLHIVETPAERSLGPNWARSILQAEVGDEPYSLLLDSHHRFVTGWDDLTLAMYRELPAAKPILSSYLPPYSPGDSRARRLREPYIISPLRRDAGVLTRLTSHPLYGWRGLDAPPRGDYVSLHFLFAETSFLTETPVDSGVYFFGDEVALSLRAFTNGWDIFCPHRVIGWHAYDRASREPHWDRHDDWWAANQRSIDHLRDLFTGDPSTRALLGTARTVHEFEEYTMQRLVAA